MNTLKKGSLYEDDDDANDIRVEREGEGRRLTRGKKGLCCGLNNDDDALLRKEEEEEESLERVLLQQRISFWGGFSRTDYSSESIVDDFANVSTNRRRVRRRRHRLSLRRENRGRRSTDSRGGTFERRGGEI